MSGEVEYPNGWNLHECVYPDTGVREFHVVPVNDLREHECSVECWCMPVLDDEPGPWAMYAHNSMDRREEFETGRAAS